MGSDPGFSVTAEARSSADDAVSRLSSLGVERASLPVDASASVTSTVAIASRSHCTFERGSDPGFSVTPQRRGSLIRFGARELADVSVVRVGFRLLSRTE